MNSPKTKPERLQEELELSLDVLDSLQEKIAAMRILLETGKADQYAGRELRFAEASLPGAEYDIRRFQEAIALSA